MPHKHRPYTAEELEFALDDGNVTLERLAATVVGLYPKPAQNPQVPHQGAQQAKPGPVHGAKR